METEQISDKTIFNVALNTPFHVFSVRKTMRTTERTTATEG